jgi:hypothetical protein
MLRRGLRTLDELEEEERKEKEEQERGAALAAEAALWAPFTFSGEVGPDVPLPSLEVLADPGSAGDTPQASQGS